MASKEDIISYVMNTPENTNPAILGDMLDSVGGGSTNTKQTITGTLADPFGSVSFDELSTALATMNASAYFEADASALGAGDVKQWLTGNVSGTPKAIYTNGASFENDQAAAFVITWNESQGLLAADMLNSGSIVDISSYAAAIPTTVTIVWHSLL